MMTTRSHFAFRIDTWTANGESIVEHVAGAEDFQIALADAAAVARRWPGAASSLRALPTVERLHLAISATRVSETPGLALSAASARWRWPAVGAGATAAAPRLSHSIGCSYGIGRVPVFQRHHLVSHFPFPLEPPHCPVVQSAVAVLLSSLHTVFPIGFEGSQVPPSVPVVRVNVLPPLQTTVVAAPTGCGGSGPPERANPRRRSWTRSPACGCKPSCTQLRVPSVIEPLTTCPEFTSRHSACTAPSPWSVPPIRPGGLSSPSC
jgi:hypothetical protein